MIKGLQEKFYVDAQGNYLGSFAGYCKVVQEQQGEDESGQPIFVEVEKEFPADIPEGGIEVPNAPLDARQKWLGDAWQPVEEVITYVEKRIGAYPPLEEQMDMLYHDRVNGTDIWFNCIRNIKQMYPEG